MPLTPEQIAEAKRQLKLQVKHFPEEKRIEAERQIDALSPEAIEQIVLESASQTPPQKKSIFRMIVDGDVPSKKLAENKDAIAVLSVKSISKGHTIIIPKKPVSSQSKLPQGAFSLAKKIAKKLETKLKSKKTEIILEEAFGEVILNVIPVYSTPVSLASPRSDVSEEELSKLHSLLKVIKRPKTIKKTNQSHSTSIKLKKRIP